MVKIFILCRFRWLFLFLFTIFLLEDVSDSSDQPANLSLLLLLLLDFVFIFVSVDHVLNGLELVILIQFDGKLTRKLLCDRLLTRVFIVADVAQLTILPSQRLYELGKLIPRSALLEQNVR